MEHLVIVLPKEFKAIRDKLDEVGNEGWELVTVVQQPTDVRYEGTVPYLAYFRKV